MPQIRASDSQIDHFAGPIDWCDHNLSEEGRQIVEIFSASKLGEMCRKIALNFDQLFHFNPLLLLIRANPGLIHFTRMKEHQKLR